MSIVDVYTPRLIKAARALTDLSQEGLAREAGVSVEIVKSIEKMQKRDGVDEEHVQACLDALKRYGLSFEDKEWDGGYIVTISVKWTAHGGNCH